MIIDCPHCDSKVEVEEKGFFDFDLEVAGGVPSKLALVECKVCHKPLLGFSELIQISHEDWDWGTLERLWPSPEEDIDHEIPEIARISLVEAQTCFKAKAYTACTVMCGRAIEGVCKHHNAKTKTLAAGLEELRDKEVIDGRIYEWGEALRSARNLGAHASTEKVSREDAKDLLDFSTAICEYVFVLNAKFERFKDRQKNA